MSDRDSCLPVAVAVVVTLAVAAVYYFVHLLALAS